MAMSLGNVKPLFRLYFGMRRNGLCPGCKYLLTLHEVKIKVFSIHFVDLDALHPTVLFTYGATGLGFFIAL